MQAFLMCGIITTVDLYLISRPTVRYQSCLRLWYRAEKVVRGGAANGVWGDLLIPTIIAFHSL